MHCSKPRAAVCFWPDAMHGGSVRRLRWLSWVMRNFRYILCVVLSSGLMACRGYSPVERHFLRVPALAAAELSVIDRGHWLKAARRQSGFSRMAGELDYLPLDPALVRAKWQAPEGEVRFFPEGTDCRSGGVALNWREPGDPAAGSHLVLLKTRGGRYLPQPLDALLPAELRAERFSLGTGRSGLVWQRAATLRWKAGGWARD
jgi:hypothetical protein